MKVHRIALLVALVSTVSVLPSCKKDKDTPITPPQTNNSISSICLGEWRTDSTFNIANSTYIPHAPGFHTFTPDGRFTMIRSDGSTEDLIFHVGDEEVNARPGEYGRVLVWFEEPENPFPCEEDPPWCWGAALLVFQSENECNMMFTDDIGPWQPQYTTLTNVHEYLWDGSDPVFDYWAKCYRH